MAALRTITGRGEENGTSDLAHSIYPEIDSTILAGPDFTYNLHRTAGFKALVAQMFQLSPLPNFKLDTNTFVSNFWNTSRETTADQYSDQHAFTPIEEDGHYAEELALTPVRKDHRKLPRRRQKQSQVKMRRTYEYAEERALSPMCKKRCKLPRRFQKKSEATKEVRHAGMAGPVLYPAHIDHSELPLRSRKQHQPNAGEIFDSIMVELPEEKQEEGVEHPVVKPARVRKRKMDEGAKPSRKSIRSRNAVSYAE